MTVPELVTATSVPDCTPDMALVVFSVTLPAETDRMVVNAFAVFKFNVAALLLTVTPFVETIEPEPITFVVPPVIAIPVVLNPPIEPVRFTVPAVVISRAPPAVVFAILNVPELLDPPKVIVPVAFKVPFNVSVPALLTRKVSAFAETAVFIVRLLFPAPSSKMLAVTPSITAVEPIVNVPLAVVPIVVKPLAPVVAVLPVTHIPCVV